MNFKKLITDKIKNKNITVGVIGLGYVGLPLLINFAKNKVKTFGFDKDKKKISMIRKNKSYIDRISNKDIKYLTSFKNNCFSKMENLKNCDIIVICVPTPLKKNLPNLSYIKSAVKEIIKNSRFGQIIILESTSYPGTTNDLIINKLKSRFIIGKNIFVGFSSERVDPGNNENMIYKIPKVVSGFTEDCKKVISVFYSMFFKKIVVAKNIQVAEFSKLLENTYRLVNIGFMNEMKMIADKMKLDIFDIIKVAETKPYGFVPYNPGPGVGGHCIPVDPHYLLWKAKKIGINSNYITLSADLNANVMKFIYSKIQKFIRLKKLNKNKLKILILGIAYKENIDDSRESSSIKLIQKLLKLKYKNVSYFDPNIKEKLNFNFKENLKKINHLNSKILKNFDLVILMTAHDIFDYKMILKYSKNIIDCRGKYTTSKKVHRA